MHFVFLKCDTIHGIKISWRRGFPIPRSQTCYFLFTIYNRSDQRIVQQTDFVRRQREENRFYFQEQNLFNAISDIAQYLICIITNRLFASSAQFRSAFYVRYIFLHDSFSSEDTLLFFLYNFQMVHYLYQNEIFNII